jgi:hypothetical protein
MLRHWKRCWKHLAGLALCAAAIFMLFVVATAWSFAGFSPDSAPTDEQRLISARGHAMQDVLMSPTQWLLGESALSFLGSWAIWTGLLYFLCYGVARLTCGWSVLSPIRHQWCRLLNRGAAIMQGRCFKWPLLLTLAVLTGSLPFGVSGLPEFCAIVTLPFVLGFLVCRWWTAALTRVVLAIALPAFGSFVRLLSSSLHDGANWFSRLFRVVGATGATDPYVRHILFTLAFPVVVCAVATTLAMSFQRKSVAKDAEA